MNNSSDSFNLAIEIPRKSLIALLKSDRVTDSLLDWASKQLDREIALAILMNSKTSQQHLDDLFETFDNFLLESYGLTRDYYHYIDQDQEYRDIWDILGNIERHINWQQKQLEGNWQADILYEISNILYPDRYWSRNLARIIDLDCDELINKIIDNYEHSQIYKNLLLQLRKLRRFPPKKVIPSPINQSAIEQAKRAKSSDKLNQLLSHKDQDFQIKYAILENPHLTEEILVKILDNVVKRHNPTQLLRDKRFDSIFSKYPHTTRKFWEGLAKRTDNQRNQWSLFLAESPHTPIHILEKLAKSYDSGILSKLAKNPKTPENILLKLVQLNHYDINVGLCSNSELPDSIKPKLPTRRLSANEPLDHWVLAYSKNTSVEDLKKIAKTSKDYRILIQIILNPNTNPEILQILAQDIDSEVRSYVAKDPKTPIAIVEKLAQDENKEVRHSIVENPNLTKDIFYHLMGDIYGCCDYSLVRLLAFLEPNVSPEILEQNADSLLWNERFALAIHPQTPQQTIQQLAQDGNIYVRTVAKERFGWLNEM